MQILLVKGVKKRYTTQTRDLKYSFEKYTDLAPQLNRMLQVFEIFYLPLGWRKEELQRIESGLIEVLRNLKGEEGQFLDNYRVSVVIPPQQRRTLAIQFPERITGIPDMIEI
jgi:hypothetical protein